MKRCDIFPAMVATQEQGKTFDELAGNPAGTEYQNTFASHWSVVPGCNVVEGGADCESQNITDCPLRIIYKRLGEKNVQGQQGDQTGRPTYTAAEIKQATIDLPVSVTPGWVHPSDKGSITRVPQGIHIVCGKFLKNQPGDLWTGRIVLAPKSYSEYFPQN